MRNLNFYNPKILPQLQTNPYLCTKPINVKYKTTSNHIYIMKKQHLIIILLFSFLLAVPAVQAQKKVLPAELEVELKYGADRLGKRQDPAMQKFRENRLGAFIHWGLYAIPGGEWNNKTYHGAAEWLKAWAKVPTTDWLELMKQWNPQQFDAKKWLKWPKKWE